MKKLNKILLIFILSILNINLSYASSINDILVVDDSNISFDVSRDVTLDEGTINSEIKVMNDINISFISKDFEDKNKLILNLSSDLKLNSNYSLITILGPEGNMDFTTGLSLVDKEIQNLENVAAGEQGMNRVLIKNPRTIELYFNNIVEEDELEFKLFNELDIKEIKVAVNNNINISLNDKLVKSSNYILMILSMMDNYGNYITLDEDLYEIATDQNLNNSSGETSSQVIKQDPIEEGTIEDVALNSAETPDTGPETTVLIMLTLIVNTVFVFRKKIMGK